MNNTRQYFDADKLIRDIYNKIVIWHNNDERLNSIEQGRELKFLSQEIAEDVLKAVHGEDVSIGIDKRKLGLVESDTAETQAPSEPISPEHNLTEEQVRDAMEASRKHRLQEKTYLESRGAQDLI